MRLKFLAVLCTALLAATGCSNAEGTADTSDGSDGDTSSSSSEADAASGEQPEDLPERDPIASRESSFDGSKVKVDLYPVDVSGELAVVTFALTNTGDDDDIQ